MSDELVAAATEIERLVAKQRATTKRLAEIARDVKSADEAQRRRLRAEADSLVRPVVDFGDAIDRLLTALRRTRRHLQSKTGKPKDLTKEWDKQLAAKLRAELSLSQDQIGVVLGLVADGRELAFIAGENRGFECGYRQGRSDSCKEGGD